MLFPVHVLEDCEARVAGLGLEKALARLRLACVVIALGKASLREAVWNLPVIEAISERFPDAELRISASAQVSQLLAAYPRRARVPAPAAGGTLEVQLQRATQAAHLESSGSEHRLLVPNAPYPKRAQHAAAHAVDAAQVAGLPARMLRPQLRLEAHVRKAARALCRGLSTRGFGGPLLVLAPTLGGWSPARFASVAAQLVERIGAQGLVFGELAVPGVRQAPDASPALLAALLSLAAVCVADDTDWAHVAAAVGTPTLVLHGASSPDHSGPNCRHGVSAFTTQGSCQACREQPGRRCLHCLSAHKVSRLAEQLSARSWPLDRLHRALP